MITTESFTGAPPLPSISVPPSMTSGWPWPKVRPGPSATTRITSATAKQQHDFCGRAPGLSFIFFIRSFCPFLPPGVPASLHGLVGFINEAALVQFRDEALVVEVRRLV